MPSGIRATRATSAATAGAAVVMPAATVKPAAVQPSTGRRAARSSRLRRSARSIAPSSAKMRGHARRSACSFSSDFSQWRARSAISAIASASRRGGSPRPAARRVSAQGRLRAAGSRRFLRPAPALRAAAGARAGRSPAAPARRRSRSSAPPIRSSSSGSPTGISRGSSSPLPLARTKASVTARTARLLGSRMRPWARPSGSFPKRAISPAASASANERWEGMVKTATRCGSGILECRFRHRDGLRGADVEPQALVDRAKARPSSIARSHRMLVENGPSGASRSRRFEAIWMPVKTKGATWLRSRRRIRPAGPCGSRPSPCAPARAPGAREAAAHPSCCRPIGRRAA